MVPVPPLALAVDVSDAGLLPVQIACEALMEPALSAGLTVTTTVAVLVQLVVVFVPVTVYVVVLIGLAVTEAPDVAESSVDGDHVYVLAPLAVNVVLDPVVIATDVGLTVTVGSAFTVTLPTLLLAAVQVAF
jgi:hypothetical protein